MSDLKTQLFKLCLEAIEERIAHAKEALDLAQESANNESKSSAGDKHETGRAMAQLEAEKATAQLNENMELKAALQRIDSTHQSETVIMGSLVVSKTARFLMAVSAGKLMLDGTVYFAISPESPIGKLLLGKKKGDSVSFNGITHEILEVS